MSYASEQGILNEQANAAAMAYRAEVLRGSPHVLMRPRLFPDGDQWCALYGDDLQHGVAGFGATPAAACENFDINWIDQRLAAPKRKGA